MEDAQDALPKKFKAPPVLPWMRVPIEIEAGQGVSFDVVYGLDERIRSCLESEKYVELFPVQAAAWRELAGGQSTTHDLCIAAPTGSGKTLAYSLPVVNGLCRDPAPVHQVQAVVVLPTQDLAVQVHTVLSMLCGAVGLRVALVAAQRSVAEEALDIVGAADPGGIPGRPAADIVIATPGRLMYHLRSTEGFTLKHLRFLVVDETDRLLRQSYQDWLAHITDNIHKWASATTCEHSSLPYCGRRVVKIVASATLTRDPSKLDRLHLHYPRYIAMSATGGLYSLPGKLREQLVVVQGARKPAALLALLDKLAGAKIVLFTSAVETTHRLSLLLEQLKSWQGKVLEYSSLVSVAKRKETLMKYRSGECTILVASDAMTRGMDVQGVEVVLNYDAPIYARTYVHRAGRTARAGAAGRVITMVRPEDMKHFKAMTQKVGGSQVKKMKLVVEDIEPWREEAQHALAQVEDMLAAEAAQQQAVHSVRAGGKSQGARTSDGLMVASAKRLKST